MKLKLFGEMAVKSIIGIAILIALVFILVMMGVMASLLIPYNIARIIAWAFEKLIDLAAFIIASIDERI